MTSQMTIPCVTTDDLGELLARDAAATVIDVRERVEWVAGHVPGAVHLPMSELVQRHEELRARRAPLYLICQSGSRSARCAEYLATAGHDVVNVLGGTGAWVRSGRALDFGG